MNVTKASLERIDQHWAIQAIGNKEINRAVELSNRLLVEKAVGVQSEEGVLLRMNSVPRTIAESLGSVMKDSMSKENRTVQDARSFLKLSDIDPCAIGTIKISSLPRLN